MAALDSSNPTLLDYAKSLDPDDNVAPVIELLSQQNDVLKSAVVMEGNLVTGHRHVIRTGIPLPTWRKMYQFVTPTKTEKVQVTDNAGMLENFAEIDKALADLNGNSAAFRLSEAIGIMEGFAQEVASTLFYGNEGAEPEAFTGLAPRFNLLSAENAENIIVGGSTDESVNTSIWLVGWGDQKNHLFFPKGSKAGLTRKDMGEDVLQDTTGGRMVIYREHFRWDVGLAQGDWRYVVRIPNIKVSALTADASTGADLIDLMTQALERIHSLENCKPVFYCNRDIRGFLRRQMVAKVKQSTLTMDMVAGKMVMALDGVPVERCDALLNTEALVA